MEYPVHAHSILTSDPAILADPVTKKYYMTSSGFTIDGKPVRGYGKIYALVSEDLIHWSEPQVIFDSTLYEGFWGKTGYPAVEMHRIRDKYYLATTAIPQYSTLHPMIVAADNPLGPFKPLSNEPYGPRDWDMLDCTLYLDEEDHPWLIYSHLWYEVSDGQMLLQSLSDDLSRTTNGPMVLFRGSDAVWSDDQIWSKTDGGGVAEAPFLWKAENGELWMLWTGRSRTGYCVGYAKSESGKIWGPWRQMERPIYAHDGGHCVLFRRFEDNQLMMSLHVCDQGPKMLNIFEMEERGGELHIVNELTGNWLDTAGGNAKPYRREQIAEAPALTYPMTLEELRAKKAKKEE